MEFALSQYDLMEKIGQDVKNIRETEKNKKLYSDIIKHLDDYMDYYEDSITPEIIYNADLRCDVNFLEFNDLYNEYEHIIMKSHDMDEESFNDLCDNWY
jgi:hypothetical protein